MAVTITGSSSTSNIVFILYFTAMSPSNTRTIQKTSTTVCAEHRLGRRWCTCLNVHYVTCLNATTTVTSRVAPFSPPLLCGTARQAAMSAISLRQYLISGWFSLKSRLDTSTPAKGIVSRVLNIDKSHMMKTSVQTDETVGAVFQNVDVRIS